MTADAFIAAARRYLGTPWRHLGRSRAGLDCIGLVLVAARDAGLSLPDPAPYEREPADARLVLEASRLARRVSPPAPGDVLVFRTTCHVGHVGICATHPLHGVPSVIHALMWHRKVQEDVYDRDMRDAFIAAFRLWEDPAWPA
jgi:cell wall-associated NlpC family hydrolase